ncbi:AMIN domain-containing protein [Desulfovibrio sp.]|uniref:AMIN domain-containing protein n=1 Tax=Desulfovibrio sp. TaxID=885 RepID=UPI0023D1D978|nr:AMIN domain-containing protein [Desulfovibrio sp.]MDE7240628.1 AMIN domain-containing protein [Desulfovibrio sp.]
MNKTIFFLILAVCILGMALILLNQRLGRAPEPRPTARSEQTVVADTPMTEPAPEYPVPAPSPAPSLTPSLAPSLAEDAPRLPDALPRAVERAAESEREASAAAAAALAVEQKEASAALHGAPAAPTPQDIPTPPAAAPAPPAQPKAAAAPPRETAPRPAAETPRQPAQDRAAAPAKKGGAQEKASGTRAITRFVVFARDNGATVRLTGNGPLRYKSMNLENPDRVVLDLEGDWEVKAPAVPKNPLVSAVRVGDMDGRTRIVIDLKGKPRTARVIPAKTGDGVDVRVDQ